MRKFLKFCLISIIIVTSAFVVYTISDKYNIDILEDNIECTIVTKGVEKSKGIAIDDNGTIYIAYEDSIKQIDSDGKEKLIYKGKDLKIEDISYYDNCLYFISGSQLNKLLLSHETVQVLVDKIPKGENGIDRNLMINDGIGYLTIGSMTNSGISEGEAFDQTPMDLILNGINYGDNKTGAFKANGEKSEEGEKIKKSPIGNSSIYKVNLSNGGLSLYAYGIRGVTGIDYTSNNEIMAIFSGMKEEGLRPIVRDKDYVYQVKEGEWYGWPDFSGGDNVTSPRFKGEEKVKALLKSYPKKIVLGPMYQHSSVDSLRELSIDREGLVFKENTLVFWDRSENVISSLDGNNIYHKVLKLGEGSSIEDIIFNGNEFLILDSGLGCIYSIHGSEGLLGFKLPVVVWLFVILLAFTILMIVVYKMSKRR